MEAMTSTLSPIIKKQVDLLTACHGDLSLFYRVLWLVLETFQRSLPNKPSDKTDRWKLERLASSLAEATIKGETSIKW
jgi:hypothetical protein